MSGKRVVEDLFRVAQGAGLIARSIAESNSLLRGLLPSSLNSSATSTSTDNDHGSAGGRPPPGHATHVQPLFRSAFPQSAPTPPVVEAATLGLEPQTPFDSAVAAAQGVPAPVPQPSAVASARVFAPRERAVPSSALGRAAGFAGLGVSLAYGAAVDTVSGALWGRPAATPGAADAGAARLAEALCRMRGAALKLGQMLSIQDEDLLPPGFQAALERVRAGADVMPRRQLDAALAAELGPSWRARLAAFDPAPVAAASIGQVHRGTLHDGRAVAIKVQYPGVAQSIESDVDNLLRVVRLTNILPKSLFVNNLTKVAKKELALECDYEYEAASQARYAALVAADPELAPLFFVPPVVPDLSSRGVLTSVWVEGVHIDRVAELGQEARDRVATSLLTLTLRELFDWRFMQTDPNWGNFLYDEATGRINLVDFGASRDFPITFVREYLHMVAACARRDREAIIRHSINMGFLTGEEEQVMLDAHVEAGSVVGIPFGTPGLYDFATHSTVTKRVTELGAVMLRHRLTPPPDDSYSLHRKLSGAFLACIKLKARVPCHQLFEEAYARFQAKEGTGEGEHDLPRIASLH
ncbi:COQ8 [Auxenochlorella protothecoides x Auxenochlorella symbiontica]